MSKFKHVSHVIFDMDGVILNTEILYTKAIENVVSRYGKVFTWDTKAKIMGTKREESSKIIVNDLDLPITGEEFTAIIVEEYKIVLVNPELFPSARKLVNHLSKNKIPIAVATSSSQDTFERKIVNYKDFFKLFNPIVCGGNDPDVKLGKPDPDIFLVTASRFPDKPKPEKCLVIEDSPNGVQSALRAGMQVIMVPDENLSKELQKDATLVIASLDEIPLEQFGLPPIKCSAKV